MLGILSASFQLITGMNSQMLIFSNALVLINAFIIISVVKVSQIWSEASSNWLLCPGDPFLSFLSTSVLSAVILHPCSSGSVSSRSGSLTEQLPCSPCAQSPLVAVWLLTVVLHQDLHSSMWLLSLVLLSSFPGCQEVVSGRRSSHLQTF